MFRYMLIKILLIAFFIGCQSNKKQFILTSENWDVWKSYIQPLPSELAWTQIPWVTTFSEGVNLAKAQEKPLLLWVMNGHPLGCT